MKTLQAKEESFKKEISSLRAQLEEKDRVIAGLLGSLSWKVTTPLRTVYDYLRKFLPDNNPLNRMKKIENSPTVPEETIHEENNSAGVNLKLEEALSVSPELPQNSSQKEQVSLISRETPIASQEAPQVNARRAVIISEASAPSEIAPYDPVVDWQNYRELSEKINKNEETRIRGLKIPPREIISLKEDEIAEQAKILDFLCTEAPLVSIVIPVFNNLKYTLECLITIFNCTKGLDYEVIIVDDGSTDSTGDVLPAIKGLVYIKNPKNLGFVRTCNEGAKRARGKFTLFLNNDVQVTEGWLKELVGTFYRHSEVGAVGPKVVYPNGRLQEAGVRIDRDCSCHLIGVPDDPDLPRYNYEKEVEYISGVCLLLETEKLRELGGFDESLAPAYCEDVDLCFRLRDRGLRIIYTPKSVIIHHLSATSDQMGSYKMQCITANQQKISERWQAQIDELNRVRLIAFYLPQFHPIPENDLWWGKGFSEWRNVAKARPNFTGHYQPHLPADFGFYDLRAVETMEDQAELAKRYGIHGFCFYYYWFTGRRLLEMPIERLLRTGKPDIPFCLCWANENWTRRWDGREQDILMKQTYSEDDDRQVIFDIMRYMRHPNYIRINGKPLFLVYRVNLFPDIRRTTETWRRICREEGIGDVYLAMVESFEHVRMKQDPSEYGFDASVEFPPHGFDGTVPLPGELLNPDFKGRVLDYRYLVQKYLEFDVPDYVRFRGLMLSWDNTARRQNESNVFTCCTPRAYQVWLEHLIRQTREQNFGDERMIFINAWNEWAEGTHLEPDQRFGHGFLEATRSALESWALRTQ